jgi:hypothetical protein
MFCHICGPAESRQWKRGRKSFWRQAWTASEPALFTGGVFETQTKPWIWIMVQ